MKKVLAAALLCAVSSFATWDYFPVQAAGKGEAKLGFGYLMNPIPKEQTSIMGVTVDVRYSIIEGLEAALFTSFPLSSATPDPTDPKKSKSCEADGDFVCPPTYGPIVVGVRYWLPMGLGIALDVDLPMQGDAYPFGGMKDGAKDETTLNFRPAIQFSTNFTPELSVGAEVGLGIYGENKSKYKEGMDLGIGVEFDYAIGSITPYIGADIGLGLGKPQSEGKDIEGSEAAKTTIDIGLGATFDINENMAADIGFIYGVGEGYKGINSDGKEATISPITIEAHFSYKF